MRVDALATTRCVKFLVVVCLLTAVPAAAGNFCQTRGRVTTCDDGSAWRKTPGGNIVPWGLKNSGKPSYHQYGRTLYGDDGSVRTKTKNGVNTRLRNTPKQDDAVVNEIYGDGEW